MLGGVDIEKTDDGMMALRFYFVLGRGMGRRGSELQSRCGKRKLKRPKTTAKKK